MKLFTRGLLVALQLVFCLALVAQNEMTKLITETEDANIDFLKVNLLLPNETAELKNEMLDKEPDLQKFSLFDLNHEAADNLKYEQTEAIQMEIPKPGTEEVMVLDLVRFNVFGDDFSITEMPSGRVIKETPDAVFYRGQVQGDQNSIAVISVIDDEISGMIALRETRGTFNLVKMKDKEYYLLYNDAQINHKFSEMICETIDLNREDIIPDPDPTQGTTRNTNECFGIFLDIGSQVYQERGGTNQAVSFLTNIFAQVVTLYANEQLNIKLSGTYVWTTQNSEPFYRSDNDEMLTAYNTYRNNNPRNNSSLYQYIHRDDARGGKAYIRALCGNYKTGWSGIYNHYRDVPNWSHTVGIIAHELGHNFGSPHTHDCVWNGNNTAIDRCEPTNCNSGAPLPSDGTIMSYCHARPLFNPVGVNFTLGFGPQPGNRIRAYAAANASCDPYNGTCGSNPPPPNNTCNFWFRNTGCRDMRVYRANSAGNFVHLRLVRPNQNKRIQGLTGQRWQVRIGSNVIRRITSNCNRRQHNINTNGCGSGAPVGNGVYAIYARHSNKVVDVHDNRTDNGANVHQWDYLGNSNQKWQLQHLGNSIYKITSLRSGKALDAELTSNNSRNVHQWDWLNNSNQKWRLNSVGRSNGRNYYHVINHRFDQCLNVSRNSSDNGANIIRYPCSNNQNDDFYFVPVSSASGFPGSNPTEEEQVKNELNVFPNPVRENLNVHMILSKTAEVGELSIIDINGRVLKSVDFNPTMGVHETNFDLSNFQSGLYILRMRTDQEEINKRIVVVK